RTRALLATLLLTLTAASTAQAKVDSVFGGALACTAQKDRGDVRQCSGIVHSYDCSPVDVNVTLPAEPAKGTDGGYPLLGMFHGWGGTKLGIATTAPWAQRGYVVFTMSDRGWGDSCGGQSQTRVTEAQACLQSGYNHLMDTRYEVRDAQTFMAALADEKTGRKTTLVDRRHIGATGGSYGGGMSMALAALKDRVMLPGGSFMPWETPRTQKLITLAAAAPEIPWTDLANSLMPNGATIDYAISPNGYGDRVGVQKTSYVAGLFGTGLATSNYSAPQTDSGADLFSWFAETSAGEPYDQNPITKSVLTEIEQHHSSYYIDPSTAPAPLLISNGWTDDLFPVDEALRFYNRTKAQYPSSFVGLEFLDYGHSRGQNKAADTAVLHARQQKFLDYFLKGEGDRPFGGVEVLTQTCGKPSGGGPYSADTWGGIAKGEVRKSDLSSQFVVSGGDPQAGRAFDPIAGGGACATASATDFPGTAVYRLPAVTGDGYTLVGAGTIIADIQSTSPANQLAARLLDEAPDGTETLVARGLFRPFWNSYGKRQLFQLHPGGWHFAKGHRVKLELLAFDSPYARPSQGQTPIQVSNLELRLPVLEQPGGAVLVPKPKSVPAGYRLAPGY
ncbi:MAG: type transport system ATP-binding protein, partial [Thermoleophilaceae bacterium]|nr:type transport system ATP-binding protein [Thermoleophilaceae bacterium]